MEVALTVGVRSRRVPEGLSDAGKMFVSANQNSASESETRSIWCLSIIQNRADYDLVYKSRNLAVSLIQSRSMQTPLIICALAVLASGVFGAPVEKQNVEYARRGNEALLLDLHIPDGPGPFPAAVLVHGGGFDEGSKSTYVKPLFAPLSSANFAWFSIDYRLAPEAQLPQASEDVKSAIMWLKKNAAAYRVDVSKIALIGESAGGFLVNYAGTHETPQTKVAAVVDFYGPSDYGKLALARRDHPEKFNMVTANRHAAHGGGTHYFGVETLDAAGLAKLNAVAPIFAVHKGMPPFLCIHGTKDDQVSYEQSTEFCAAIRGAGVPCDLITVDGGGHGMSSWRAPEMQHWKPEMIAWLKKTLSVN